MLRDPALEPAAIRWAYADLPTVFRDSPQYIHEGLSGHAGRPIIVKVETANPIRSFKGRGTWIAVQRLAADGLISATRPVVCASAGNFGQGVAYAARTLGIPSVVFCATNANPGKVARMRALGAEVRPTGDDFDAAREASLAFVAGGGGESLVDGDDVRISTGAATLALEVTEAIDRGELPEPVVASIPVGNGALINGVASWLRATTKGCRILGVQAEGADAMIRSWHEGHPVDTEAAVTFADGIASRIAIPLAVRLLDGRVDDMVAVSEDDLRAAQALLTAELGITVEGAAAATWAGLLRTALPEGPALLIITGSNT